MSILFYLPIFFVVGIIAGFTNNKREQFQLLFRLVLPASLIIVIPLLGFIGTKGDIWYLVGYFLISPALYFLGTVISSKILFFTKSKRGEKPETGDF